MKATQTLRHELLTGFLVIFLFSSAMAERPIEEQPQSVSLVKFAPPDIADIPADEDGKQILLGRRLLAETKKLLPDKVGDALNCTSCHLNDGRVARGIPFFGVAVNYPQYNARAGRSLTLEDRINGCFLRSMNGKILLSHSAEMTAMIAYLSWMSNGLPQYAKVEGAGLGKVNANLVPDPAHGKEVYEIRCAACHGTNGQGLENARSEFIVPPVWGGKSFNIGAGMARTYSAAAFIKNNMPLNEPGVLSEQEAVDVAEYFTHQPRPDFPAKVKDWPNGDKPKDARY